MTSIQVRSSDAAPSRPVVENTVFPNLQLIEETEKLTCGEVCRFDDWYQRARCESRNLNYVPVSTGCEGAIMLELQDNQLSQLTTASIVGYELVKTLDLSRNCLKFVQNGIFMNMNVLQNILISNNFLKEMENFTFTGTEDSLKRIYLNHNKIETIRENAFHGLIRVTLLHMSYNQIEFLHESAFRDMYALRHLHLSNNNLHYLARNTFKDLSNLKSITLSKNKFKWIPRELFSGLTSLREVTLAGNQLVTIPPPKHLGIDTKLELLNFQNNDFNTTCEILPYLNISVRLLLGGNPFICDCTFMTIRQWYQNKSNTDHHIQHDQTGCFWNESFISVTDEFPAHCEGSSVGNFSMQTESPDEKQYPNFSVAPTPWTSQEQVPFTSTETVDTILPPLSTEYDRCANLNNQKFERQQRIMSIYCVTVLTLFFILWLVKTLVIHFKGK